MADEPFRFLRLSSRSFWTLMAALAFTGGTGAAVAGWFSAGTGWLILTVTALAMLAAGSLFVRAWRHDGAVLDPLRGT